MRGVFSLVLLVDVNFRMRNIPMVGTQLSGGVRVPRRACLDLFSTASRLLLQLSSSPWWAVSTISRRLFTSGYILEGPSVTTASFPSIPLFLSHSDT